MYKMNKMYCVACDTEITRKYCSKPFLSQKHRKIANNKIEEYNDLKA